MIIAKCIKAVHNRLKEDGFTYEEIGVGGSTCPYFTKKATNGRGFVAIRVGNIYTFEKVRDGYKMLTYVDGVTRILDEATFNEMFKILRFE